MRPVSRKALSTFSFLSGDFYQEFGKSNTVASIKGSVKKLGSQYAEAKLVLFNKASMLPILVKRPDTNGNYQFLGLNTDLKTFVVAFDQKQQFNAVIQDNVVPK